MNPQDVQKGAGGIEDSPLGGAKTSNPPGVYQHKAAGKTLIVLPDPQSSGQADALVRMGFEHVGPPPSGQDLRDMQTKQAEVDAKAEKDGALQVAQVAPFDQPVIWNGSSKNTNGPASEEAFEEAAAKKKPKDAPASETTNEEGK